MECFENNGCGFFPGEFFCAFDASGFEERLKLSARGGIEELMERLGDIGDIEGIDEDGSVSDEMRERTGDARDDRGSARHGFEDRETEAFVK